MILALMLLVLPISMLHAIGLVVSQQGTNNPGGEEVATQSQEATEFADALDALDKRVDTPDFRVPGNAEASAGSRLLYSLQSLPPVERYQLLKSWTFPTRDRKSVRNLMGLMNDVPPPAVFLPAPLPVPEEPLVCTLSLLVEAAREAHKLAELSRELKPLLKSETEGAGLLERMIETVRTGDKAVRPRVSALLSEREFQQFLASAQGSANFASVVWRYRERALHWLTTNRSIEDTDGWIATSNVAVESECRRGPSPLPLKINDWNACVVEIRDGIVSLTLNGQRVYERPMEVAAGAKFGLYHDRTRTSARVRNVVLTGDWPEWSPELAANLLERRNPLTPADTEAIENILTPRLTADEPEEM